MELSGKVREGREIIRFVLLIPPECYEIVVWIEIVTGEPAQNLQIIYTNTQYPESIIFLLCVKTICNKKSRSLLVLKKQKQNKKNRNLNPREHAKNKIHGKPTGISIDFPIYFSYVHPSFWDCEKYLVGESCSQV